MSQLIQGDPEWAPNIRVTLASSLYLYVCIYVCMYIAICSPCAHRTCAIYRCITSSWSISQHRLHAHAQIPRVRTWPVKVIMISEVQYRSLIECSALALAQGLLHWTHYSGSIWSESLIHHELEPWHVHGWDGSGSHCLTHSKRWLKNDATCMIRLRACAIKLLQFAPIWVLGWLL